MAKIIGLPKLSPTMDEGVLVRWTKNEGDSVEVDDLLAEVETDKATMEFRSFDRGVLLKRLVSEGTSLKPDEPVAIIGEKGEDVASLVRDAKTKDAPSAVPPTGGNGTTNAAIPPPAITNAPIVSTSIRDAVTVTPPPPAPAPQPALRAAMPPAAPDVRRPASSRPLASPLVRRLARERGVDLGWIHGTGPHGRIIKRDLENVRVAGAAGSSLAMHPELTPKALPENVPLTQMRKTIARRLSESKREVPHFYLTIDIDAEPLSAARESINRKLKTIDEKVSVNDLVIKACAVALRQVPAANASFSTDHLTYHRNVDISVAVAIPDGLVTPVVRGADAKDVLTISREVRELAGRAKEKKLKPEEMTGGTFSISNLGMFGIDEFSAVINPPEGAILAVGRIREVPVVKGGAIAPGKRMSMTLSCDHRVIDGAVGATYLAALRELLENPVTIFA